MKTFILTSALLVLLLSACKKTDCEVVEKVKKTVTLSGIQLEDANLDELNQMTNYGNVATFDASSKYNINVNNLRALMKFDLSSIPQGATITSAKLSLYSSSPTAHSANGVICEILNVSESWSESTVTWATQPATGSVSLAVPAVVTPNQDLLNFDITSIIIGQYLNPGSRFGIMLKVTDESSLVDRWVSFTSSEYTAIPTRVPVLVIEYELQ